MANILIRPIVIFEDSDDDFEAMERALKRTGPLLNPIVRFESGSEGLAFVKKCACSALPEEAPLIIMLDLNLPGMDGRSVLEDLKSEAVTRDLPVIILTTSDDPQDIDRCYAAGANSYIKKPVSMESFVTAIQRLKDYWLDVALLPRSGGRDR